MKMQFDAVIIGGGASGLMCAVAAKLKNQKLNIAIIEKNDRVGKKLLSTGNGRCNLTNKNVATDKYKGTFDGIADVLKRYDTDKLLSYFKNLGLLTFCDSEGRYYPVSKQASSVLDVLRFNAERLGVTILCKQNIHSISRQNGFTVKTADGVITADKLVICCGSKASPKLGGSASASDYLKNLGHTVIPFSPALCPIKVDAGVIKSLKGLRSTATVTLSRNGKEIKAESGEVQFADGALSGICVFNLSLYAEKGDKISLDLADYISDKELYSHLLNNKKLFADLTAENIFTGILQKRLAQAVLKAGKVELNKSITDLTEKELKALVKTAKNMTFTVTGNAGFEQAQCALGGVKGNEIDGKTMQSRRVNNLYICGEAIDVCGECGGYNLHFAFASGIIAGESL